MRFEEYERGRWSEYAAFSSTVADIVRAAIETAGGYRFQQVRARAKAAISLRKKLEKLSRAKGIDFLASDNLEGEIKDLAGCRVIFYTNNDVNQLINSGLIWTNFEVVETKLHHPRRDAEEATELYISNHYLVRLRENRLALPEYARFAGMRCEIQVQTILNHAWAEMAHDTIYKQPDLDTFGTKALEAIKIRMGRIARRYLVPAGHEFAKVSADFERLMSGKELFEGGALQAIVEASDNNERADALDTFVDGVLPLYDDITPEYPDILDAMIEAAARARTLTPKPVSTPYGELPAKAPADVVDRIVKIITDYRYVDSAASFDALLALYAEAQSKEERKSIADAAKRLAEHNLHVWRRYGAAVQIMLVDKISQLDEAARRTALPLLVSVLGAVLGAEITGTTSSSGSVTFHRGMVVASDALSAMRREATAQLRSLYVLADTDADRSAVLGALHQATRSPDIAVTAPELAETLLESAAAFVEFEASLVPAMSWELLQREERNVLSLGRRNRALAADLLARPTVQALHARTEAAVAAFRAAVAAEVEYDLYKVLVGYDVVYPPAWDLDRFGYREQETYRRKAVDDMVESLATEGAEAWHTRVVRCASTDSDDLATFPMFNRFLQQAGERRPAVVLGWLERLEPSLSRFVPHMLLGLQRSAHAADAEALARRWVKDGRCLGEIAWYGRISNPFDETLLIAVADRAIEVDDRAAVRTAMAVAGFRFAEEPGLLVEKVFLPGLAHMHQANDTSWVGGGFSTWFYSEIIIALDEAQAAQVLDALLHHPEIEQGAASIVGSVAARWPLAVLQFFSKRLSISCSEEQISRFRAVPYGLGDEMREALARHPDEVIATVRTWLERDEPLYHYHASRFIAAVFSEFKSPLSEKLQALAAGDRTDVAFTLKILAGFEGAEGIEPVVRTAVAHVQPGDELLDSAKIALTQTGVVTGEFGFVDRYETQLTRMRAWLADEDENVRAFARSHIGDLERAIAGETRQAEARRAARRLDYGENLEEPSGDT